MLVIAKRSMLFRENVPLKTNKKTLATAEVRKPWTVWLKNSMVPQEAPDFLMADLAFKHAVAAGVIVLLQPPKLAA